jgi:VWFA-related protein
MLDVQKYCLARVSPVGIGVMNCTLRPRGFQIVILTLFVLAQYKAHGQEPPLSVIQVRSRLVQLDVTVLDKSGVPISNLSQSDFTIYEDGVPQRIRNFDSSQAHQLPAESLVHGIHGTADLQRLAPDAPVTVLVLDEFNTAFRDTAFARLQIRKFLAKQPETLTQPTSLLVATDDGFEQVNDYTLNRQELLDSLRTLKPSYPAGLMRMGGSREGIAIRFAQTLASLQQIAQAGIGHQGRKNIVWVGRGFNSIDLRNEPDHQVQLVKGAAERALNLLRDAHVTLYTIDPTISTVAAAELNAEQTETDAAAFLAETHKRTDPFDGTVSFNTLAPETGGRAFALNNDLDTEISTSVSEGGNYYTLAYVPAGDIDAKDPYRRIDVRVDRPDVTVVTRHGYFAEVPSPPRRTVSQDIKNEGFELSAAMSSKMTYTGLGVSASPSASDSSQYIVQVATTDLSWSPNAKGGPSAHMIIAAIALDAKDKPVSKNAKDVTASVGPDVSPTAIPFANLGISLADTSKAVRVRIAVRDQQTGKLGTADIILDKH